MMSGLASKIIRGFSIGVQPGKNIKRFYKSCTYVQNSSPAHSMHRYVIKLDDKQIYTPNRHILAVPSPTLAHLIADQFNHQQKYLVSSQMPMLALCRTAVDADIQANVQPILKKTICDFLKTDTLNFYEDQYKQHYFQQAKPLVEFFSHDFHMKIEPSPTLDPPQVQISPQFIEWIQNLNNWQLIGLQTMTTWLQSTIAAYSIIKEGNIEKANRAANLEQIVQIQRSGTIEQKEKLMRHMKAMIMNGLMIFKYGMRNQKDSLCPQSQLQNYRNLTKPLKQKNTKPTN